MATIKLSNNTTMPNIKLSNNTTMPTIKQAKHLKIMFTVINYELFMTFLCFIVLKKNVFWHLETDPDVL
jgi:hypothetical protein